MNFFLFLLILSTSPSWAGKVLDEYISVNPYTLPGDSEYNHLSLPGVRFHESNDYYGKTDKLMTEVTSLNVMGVWLEHFATSFAWKGRFVQPILKTRYKEDELPEPIGIYAEWAEVTLNQSATFFQEDSWVALKLDGGIGYNDFGEHNFADVYRFIHTAVGSQDDLDKFGEKQDDHFISTTASASLIFPFSDQINLMGSYQVMNSKIFREDAQEISLVIRHSESFAFSVKYSFVKQIRSEFYDLHNTRKQYLAALRLFKFWTPSLMYVSSYVLGDNYGQWYLSPLSVTYPF